MPIFRKVLLLTALFISSKAFSQPPTHYETDPKKYKKSINGGDPNGVYAQAAKLCEAAAEKYDAKGCAASAAYLRKVRDWNLCMVSNLSGNSCGLEPVLENAPKCDAATIGGANLAVTSDPYKQMQLKQQQTQQELTNAQNVSMSAYQEAINSGRKESGAMVDATLAGASQLSDAKGQLIYTGVGLGLALLMHSSEKKAEGEQKEVERRAEEERINLIINTKNDFIKEALDINKYSFSDLVSKDRYATILLEPKSFSADEDIIYFTYPVSISKYSDGSYPLKPEIEKKLLLSIDRSICSGKMVHTLYPITNLEKFNNDFVKKMGSGKVIKLNAQLLNLTKNPFLDNNVQKGNTDFWGNPVKSDTMQKVAKPKPIQQTQNNFWDN